MLLWVTSVPKKLPFPPLGGSSRGEWGEDLGEEKSPVGWTQALEPVSGPCRAVQVGMWGRSGKWVATLRAAATLRTLVNALCKYCSQV